MLAWPPQPELAFKNSSKLKTFSFNINQVIFLLYTVLLFSRLSYEHDALVAKYNNLKITNSNTRAEYEEKLKKLKDQMVSVSMFYSVVTVVCS